MVNNQTSKSNLAKLLATENINVVYQQIDTASFDIKNRNLTIPLLNDMTNDMQDLFIGHEVGHALDTPIEYGKVQEGMPSGFKTFLNVIEDARIERKIKDRYPGLRKVFFSGYKQFIDRDFFQVNGKNINRMLLIDRINMYFKIGPFFRVNFDSIEQEFVNKVSKCETFDDVVAVAKELYEYCKDELEKKKEEAKQQAQEKNNGLNDSDDSDDSDDSEDSDEYDDYEYSNDDDSENSMFGKDSDEQSNDDLPKELKNYDDVKSVTDENLQSALKNMAQNKQINSGILSKSEDIFDYSKIIVSYKEFLGKFFDSKSEYYEKEYKKNLLTDFENKNKNAISYLVKEFELRKRAAELRRVVISNTGRLDTNKLHTYKFNDDIFRKIGSVAAGKNHGIVMFLDWSGSMAENFSGTIEQLITLTSFCRKVSIPFEVYAFSTNYIRFDSNANAQKVIKNIDGQLGFDGYFSLMNIFSSRMKNQEYRLMANDLLNYGAISLNYYSGLRREMSSQLSLGGTPLNETICAASGIVNRFRKAYKSEIVDVIFLTDGEDSDCIYTTGGKDKAFGSVRIGPSNSHSNSYIHDKETKKQYHVGRNGITPVLLQILKDRTDCNLIGFYIIKPTQKSFLNATSRLSGFRLSDDELFKKFRSDKFHLIDNYGYDQYFLIPGEKYLKIESEGLTDILGDEKANARKLKGAFLKLNKNRLLNRVLLSKVIEQIA